MKTVLVFAVLACSMAGCANSSSHPAATDVRSRSSNDPGVSPQGTDVGTSNPGVNQPTTTTTATRADSPPQ